MENVGGDLNAYTNKEETVIYSAFLTEHFGRAFELLVDIVFHSTFPQREIEKETRGDYRRDTVLRRQSFRANLR